MNNFLYVLAAGILIVLGTSPDSHAADPSKFSAHFTPAPISEELRNKYYEAFLNRSRLDISRVVPDVIPSTAKEKDVWLGNEPKLSADFEALELNFEPLAADSVRVEKSFQLTFLFRRDVDNTRQIIVRTSKPGSTLYEGGIIFHLSGLRVRKSVLHGQRGVSVLFGLPETVNHGLFGIIACPLNRPSVVKPASPVATPEPEIRFRLVSARIVGISGDVEGTALSGVRPGMARANIATSPNISNDAAHFDETFSKDPYTHVRFQGGANTELIPLPEQKLLEGLMLRLELQTNAGYTRETELVELIEVAPVERPFDFSAIVLGRETKASSQSCYSILRSSRIRNLYSKSEYRIAR